VRGDIDQAGLAALRRAAAGGPDAIGAGPLRSRRRRAGRLRADSGGEALPAAASRGQEVIDTGVAARGWQGAGLAGKRGDGGLYAIDGADRVGDAGGGDGREDLRNDDDGEDGDDGEDADHFDHAEAADAGRTGMGCAGHDGAGGWAVNRLTQVVLEVKFPSGQGESRKLVQQTDLRRFTVS